MAIETFLTVELDRLRELREKLPVDPFLTVELDVGVKSVKWMAEIDLGLVVQGKNVARYYL